MTLECSSSSSSSSSLPNGKHQFESSIGCLISLISNCGSRFEGVIDHLDLEDRRVMIRNVTRNGLTIAPDMIFSRSEVKACELKYFDDFLPRKPEASLDYKTALVGRSIYSHHFPKLKSAGSNFANLECSSSRYQFEASLDYKTALLVGRPDCDTNR